MRDNKIVSGRIVLISLSDYEDDKKLYVDYHSRDIGERIYNIVSTNLCPTSYRNYYSFSERDRIERCLKAALNNNYVILEIDRNYVSKRLGDILFKRRTCQTFNGTIIMNVIRVTGNTKNRIDAIFTGSKYLFFSPDFGLVAIATRISMDENCSYFNVELTEQIKPKLIYKVVEKEEASIKRICQFNCINLGEMPQHTLPYVIDLTLERR